jgi:hypothetical protein
MQRQPCIPACTRCGDRIGVYEPFWVQLVDGTLRSSSYLNLDQDLGRQQSPLRQWHRGCLALEDALGMTDR